MRIEIAVLSHSSHPGPESISEVCITAIGHAARCRENDTESSSNWYTKAPPQITFQYTNPVSWCWNWDWSRSPVDSIKQVVIKRKGSKFTGKRHLSIYLPASSWIQYLPMSSNWLLAQPRSPGPCRSTSLFPPRESCHTKSTSLNTTYPGIVVSPQL